MGYPEGIGAVDLMIGFPMRDKKAVYEYLMRGIKDTETKDEFTFPAEYMFKDVPEGADDDVDPIDEAFAEMDKYGVDKGLFGNGEQAREAAQALPGPRLHVARGRPQRRHGFGAQDQEGGRAPRPQGGDRLPVGLPAAGPRRRRQALPGLRGVHRGRHPRHRERGHRRAALPVRRVSTSSASTGSATTSPTCAS